MTDKPKPTIDERLAARNAREVELRLRLADLQFDGPYDFSTGFDPMSAMFGGGGRDRFAICLRCGAAVVLNDPEERPDGPPLERSVRLHSVWHEQMDAPR